ncbi:MAG: hypothetical protein ABIO55_03980 [Ginsengibacter sp.]
MSCSTQHKSQNQFKEQPAEKLNVSNRENAENKIVFLTLQMTLADSLKDTYSFSLTNIIFAEGALGKNLFNNDIPVEPHYLYCEITDERKKRVEVIKVQNPLMKVFEYSADKQTLEKKLFTSNTGELFLRFQFTKISKYLTIYKPQPGSLTLKKIYYAQI